jgi:hypothetical protein
MAATPLHRRRRSIQHFFGLLLRESQNDNQSHLHVGQSSSCSSSSSSMSLSKEGLGFCEAVKWRYLPAYKLMLFLVSTAWCQPNNFLNWLPAPKMLMSVTSRHGALLPLFLSLSRIWHKHTADIVFRFIVEYNSLRDFVSLKGNYGYL